MELPNTPSFSLDGKRALIVGASSGIGLAAASAIIGAGATTTLVARDEARLAAVARAFEANGQQAAVHAMDITQLDTVAAFVDSEPPFDVLVNSAGLARHTPACDTTEADFDAVMSINVKAAYFLTQTVAKQLIKHHRPGSLINVSSQMGQVGGIDRAVYCASKHAVEGFTKAMAIEWGGHGIRVNTLSPTFIRTPLTQSTFDNPERRRWIEEKIKLGRVGELEDIMGGIVYLASDASKLVTGTSLLVDGGWTAD